MGCEQRTGYGMSWTKMAFHSMPRATQQRVGRTRRNQKLRIAAGRCGEAFVRKTLRLFQIWHRTIPYKWRCAAWKIIHKFRYFFHCHVWLSEGCGGRPGGSWFRGAWDKGVNKVKRRIVHRRLRLMRLKKTQCLSHHPNLGLWLGLRLWLGLSRIATDHGWFTGWSVALGGSYIAKKEMHLCKDPGFCLVPQPCADFVWRWWRERDTLI